VRKDVPGVIRMASMTDAELTMKAPAPAGTEPPKAHRGSCSAITAGAGCDRPRRGTHIAADRFC